MPACLVNKCLNRTGRKGQSREIVLHKFPNDPVRIRTWLQQTGQSFRNVDSLVKMIHEGQKKNKYWLCSIHFTADAYVHARVLRQDAIPSIFPPVKEGESVIQENLKKVRVRRKRPLQWTTTENMDVQLSSTSEGIYPEGTEIRQFTWTGNMDGQSSSTSADVLTEDTDIKPFKLTGNVNVRSSCITEGTSSENTEIRQFTWTGNMDVQSPSTLPEIFPDDPDIKPLQLTLTTNMDVQSPSASEDIFPEDKDIKPNISKPRCCTIGTQTEFALCNSTVKFFDQEDKAPADPVVTETPVQSPVLSTPMGPTGKIALLDLYGKPRILLLC